MGSSAGDTATGDRRRRVLLFPLPYQGHINPMFQLAGLLHSRGFAVTVFHTHFNAPDASLHPAYDFVPVPVPVPNCMPDEANPDAVQATLDHILAMNRACEAPFRERLAALLEQQRTRDGVACLIADTQLLSLLDVARELGVPTLALRTGSAACFRMFAAFPALCDKGYLPAQESQLDAPVGELPPYRVRDLPSSSSSACFAVISEAISRIVTAAATSSGLILNTFDALEPAELALLRQELATVPVFDIGPLHKLSPAASNSVLQQDRGCLDWLDTQAPASVLYISFGSIASMSATDLVETAWGIANSGRPFLWVLRPGLVRGAPPESRQPPLPDGFHAATRGRGTVVRWAPQEEVLAHPAVGGFWTHCGWNSTLEAVCAGVPMMCRPSFGDQMGNARYVDHVWRIGLALDGGEVERGEVEAAVAALMDGGGEPGAGMRRRALELKSRAAETSCLNVDKLVSHILAL
ncbi:DIMBOA UDP-glucosyltransferase BX8 [Dichanthelium oligosanthes]|uniref:DIMBOA UDP-glucosyltransferase BX8 n=1 Tax=Dichanthelium oligosanthes TaxID=888268 RepID=A0A1E5V8L6_9POAL|nr:DIMBOA UDP-glucosyltransferase BX8 [Dichanthelium oligosanthes]